MNRSAHPLRKLLALVLALLMCTALFTGCDKAPPQETQGTEPSETIEQTVAPTDEPTEPPTEEPTETPTEPVVTVPPVTMGTVNSDNLNVRTEASFTADILSVWPSIPALKFWSRRSSTATTGAALLTAGSA